MTRKKRSPPPVSPNKRVAFEIPDSLTQLSALSRSLAQRTDNVRGVNKEMENTNIIARAQALSSSPPVGATTAKPAKPFRWRHDQKDFPAAQTWINPDTSETSQARARNLELARQADMIASIHRGQSLQSTSSRQQDRAGPVVQGRAQTQAPIGTQGPRQPLASETLVSGKKRNHNDFVNSQRGGSSGSQPMPVPTARSASQTYETNIEQRRQAIIAQLKDKGPVSVAAAGTNIQTLTQPSVSPSLQDLGFAQGGGQTLDLSKDSSHIATLMAQKRAQNAATGKLNRLKHLQVEHQQQGSSRRSWPGAMQPAPSFAAFPPPISHLPAWLATPSLTLIQPSIETSVPPPRTGYAEASVAKAGSGNDSGETDLRSLFSSPGSSGHSGNVIEGAETAPALQNVNSQTNNYATSSQLQPSSSQRPVPSQTSRQGATSPSAQLLSNLANVSSDALAQLQTQGNSLPHFVQPPQQPSLPTIRSSQTVPRRTLRPPIQTPQAQAKIAALTPKQQELMLIQQQTERNQQEERNKERRRIAEEKAKVVQAENLRLLEQNQSQNHLMSPDLQQTTKAIAQPLYRPPTQYQAPPATVLRTAPQPSMGAHTTNFGAATYRKIQPFWMKIPSYHSSFQISVPSNQPPAPRYPGTSQPEVPER
jgi:hypothetical protein